MALAEDRIAEAEPGPPPRDEAADREFQRAAELHQAGHLPEATRGYVRAVQIDPGHRQALNNLGVVLRAQGLQRAALAAYRRALALQPGDPGLLGNIGNVLRDLGRLDEALLTLHRAVQASPQAAGLHQNLGLVLADLGYYREAIGCFDRALGLRPGHRRTELDRAFTLLCGEDYGAGFEILARQRADEETRDRLEGIALWTGQDLSGQTILLHGDRDLADAIQLIRLAPQVKARGARVLLECPTELAGLFGAVDGVDDLQPWGGDPWGIDLHAPLRWLPKVLGLSAKKLPARVPYLRVPPRAGFALRHPTSARATVGIAWSDGRCQTTVRSASAGLAPFFALLEHPDLAVYSLQQGAAAGDLVRLGAAGLVHDLSNLLTGLDDIARVIDQLDLVITVDSPAAHLAGALGKPVWTVVPAICDWRWRPERETTPWYPTMRLFRQPSIGDWDGALEAVARHLELFLAAKRM